MVSSYDISDNQYERAVKLYPRIVNLFWVPKRREGTISKHPFINYSMWVLNPEEPKLTSEGYEDGYEGYRRPTVWELAHRICYFDNKKK